MSRVSRRIVAFLVAAPLAVPGTLLAQEPKPERPTLQLTLDDAVKRALENNLDIQVATFDPKAAHETVRQAEGFYDLSLSSTLRDSRTTTQATNVFSGGAAVTTDTKLWNFGLFQPVQTGATLTATFNNNKSDNNSVFSTVNPTYTSFFSLGLTQPLLRNGMTDINRTTLKINKKNKEISDVTFRQIVTNVLAVVKGQYIDVVAAIDNLEAQRKSLALAQKLLDENRIKVRVGTLAPLDVVSAQSEVATREANVIQAEKDLADAEDAIRKSIYARNTPETWATHIVPVDRPVAEPTQIDIDAAIKRALESRTDVQIARKNLEINDYSLRYNKNQTLPQLDLQASYGGTGIGGTQLIRNPPQGGPVVSTVPGGYSDALGFAFGFDFPTWAVGVQFSYPIWNRAAKANAARAQLAMDQAQVSLARLEMSIASELRTAGRAVDTNWKLVESTKAARILQAQRLDAEEKKFAAGMTTNFFVTQAQRDLAVAEVAELQAISSYRKSIINFERAQESGLSAGGGSITVNLAQAIAR